jgi:hypothetical protein
MKIVMFLQQKCPDSRWFVQVVPKSCQILVLKKKKLFVKDIDRQLINSTLLLQQFNQSATI